MHKFVLFLLFSFSPIYSFIIFNSPLYAPMSKRTFEFDVENICSYTKPDFIYVKPCEKYHKCEILFSFPYLSRYKNDYSKIGICTEYSEENMSFDSSCENDDDCFVEDG
jgi:hypothetical protein